MEKDLWIDVGNKALKAAETLLDENTTPTAATAEAVYHLVKAAVEIDTLNLRWNAQSQSGGAASWGLP